MIYTGNVMMDEFRTAMKTKFEMTNLSLMKYFLNIEVEQSSEGIFICQQKYATDNLKGFKMNKCKSADKHVALGTKIIKEDKELSVNPRLYKRLVGSLMYLSSTRPDIMYAVSLISMFMESPKDSHWKVGKRILRYIAGTINCGISYISSNDNSLLGYTDSDFACNIDDQKSTSYYAFHLGMGFISWDSKKHPIMTIS